VHVWMLHKRLLQEGEEGKVLEEALFDRLWYVPFPPSLPSFLPPSLQCFAHPTLPPSLPPFPIFHRDETTARIRALKVNELSVNSYVKEVQAYSFGACVSYDAAQALDTEEDRVDELAGALYRYLPPSFLPSLPSSHPPSLDRCLCLA